MNLSWAKHETSQTKLDKQTNKQTNPKQTGKMVQKFSVYEL